MLKSLRASVGIQQGSAFSAFLFVLFLDAVTRIPNVEHKINYFMQIRFSERLTDLKQLGRKRSDPRIQQCLRLNPK